MLSLVSLPVGVFSIINCEDVEDLFLLVDDVEDPVLPHPIAPSFRGISLKLLDVVAPKGRSLELGIDKRVELSPQKGRVARRQLLEALQEFIGFEYAEFRQNGLVWPSRRGGRSSGCD